MFINDWKKRQVHTWYLLAAKGYSLPLCAIRACSANRLWSLIPPISWEFNDKNRNNIKIWKDQNMYNRHVSNINSNRHVSNTENTWTNK